MKKLFLLAANIMLLCKFFTSVVLAHYHEKNFISDERIFRAKTVRCVYPTVAVTNWDKIDEPSLGIDEQDPGLGLGCQQDLERYIDGAIDRI